MTITKPEAILDIGIDEDCPVCAQNLPLNDTVMAAIAEGDAIFFGKKTTQWYSTFEEGREALEA
ncbi:MAG: hypothetical protein FWC97_00265 [Treponema sp.]|nr:hypothetical protein [Treponema sp.]